ncbi:Uncharacterized protein CCMA1212_008833 [Trichoderma ghanense]|uniref:MOZ protein represents a chromatin-associated acetyltransferase n=1 Tax=Trichoderma ghanense TaxID=65468 RepID=A0ABY2GU77_9HYPO
MAAVGRLAFLYPQLLRTAAAAARGCGPTVGWATTTTTTTASTTSARWNSSFAKRHGKAVEPAEWEKQQQGQKQQQDKDRDVPPETTVEGETPDSTAAAEAAEAQAQAKTDIGKLFFREGDKKATKAAATDAPEMDAAAALKTQQQQQQQQQESKAAQGQSDMKARERASAETEAASSGTTPPKQADASDASASASASASTTSGSGSSTEPKHGGPKMSDKLDTVYYMGAPENLSQQAPSMAPPKYVHHFDSYSLVKQLQEGGYRGDQAVTMMKAIRTILAHNLDMAQERLVSKSDVENESYLFSAACSELSAEVRNNRRAQDEQIRQQRTHLQHEVDILTQTLNQELLTLNDNVRGLFNDRKMTVREEQKAMESRIQQINYKISIMLSSDSKSEIEGVRWILIRRSVVGILFMAILMLGTIRYATYVSHERQREADRKKKEEEELRKDGGKNDRSSGPDAAAILAAN